MTPMADFKGKRICLTGGTDGIGLALARLFAAAEADVLVIGRRPPEAVTLPPSCRYFAADLSRSESASDISAHCLHLGWTELHALIHNAATGYVGTIAAESPASIRTLCETNLKSPIALTQRLFPLLLKAEGSVCFIGSTLAGRTAPDFATYTATKTGLQDFARNLRVEWQDRIRVIEVDPGPTRTAFHAKAGMENPPLAEFYMTAEEVAQGILRAVASGRRKTRFGAGALAWHAVRRRIPGGWT